MEPCASTVSNEMAKSENKRETQSSEQATDQTNDRSDIAFGEHRRDFACKPITPLLWSGSSTAKTTIVSSVEETTTISEQSQGQTLNNGGYVFEGKTCQPIVRGKAALDKDLVMAMAMVAMCRRDKRASTTRCSRKHVSLGRFVVSYSS